MFIIKKYYWSCIYLILICLLNGNSAAENQSSTDPALEKPQQELTNLEQKVRSLSEELTGRQADRQALSDELQAREREIAQLAVAGRDLARLLQERTRVAATLHERNIVANRELDQELKLLSDLIHTAYIMGRADRLRLLLNQQDPAQASRILSYFAYFNRERMRKVLAVQGLVDRLQRLTQDAQQEATRLTELAKNQENTRQRWEEIKRQRSEVLKQLEVTIANRTENLQALQKDAEALRALIEQLRLRGQIQVELNIQHQPFAAKKGHLIWPIMVKRILADFGTSKENSELRWDGVLLAAREGEEVHAIHDGKIVYADWLRGFGLLLIIDHGDGFLSLYGHNEALLREVGEWVTTGEIISLSGNSGGRGDPVLYFAIRHNGRPQNPGEWCRS